MLPKQYKQEFDVTKEQFCKLTTKDLTTYNGFQWEIGNWVTTAGTGELCTNGWIHIYTHPLLAVVFNPIHAGFKDPIIWRIEIKGNRLNGNGVKAGVSSCRLVEQIELPRVSIWARVRWAIELSLRVYNIKDYHQWANAWLSGKDRTYAAADAAADAAATAAAYAAASSTAATASAYADAAASTAATAAAYAANAATATAATAAAAAAYAVAAYAADNDISLDLINTLKQAIQKES